VRVDRCVSWSLKIKGCKDEQDFLIYKDCPTRAWWRINLESPAKSLSGRFVKVTLPVIFAVRFVRKGQSCLKRGFWGDEEADSSPGG
jgi:hypothetical protein